VASNQLIAVLDADEYKQQVEQARAEVAVAKANVADALSSSEVAKRELERYRTLLDKKIASEADLDRADAQYKAAAAKHQVALAQVTQREAALRAVEVRLSYTEIRLQWQDGEGARVVGERFADEGAMLKANDPILSVLDISSLRGAIHVIERDYSKVHEGQDVVVTTDAFPGRTFPGKIVRVAPLLKEASRQAKVEIEVPNPAPDWPLKPGMYIRAAVEFRLRKDVTVVALSSVVRRGGQQGVFVADPKERKARFVPLSLGVAEGELVEVVKPELSGLIVTLGQHLLEDGSAILLPEAGEGAPAAPPAAPEAPAAKRGER